MHPTDGAPLGLAWAETAACTVPTADRPLRVAGVDARFAAHLRGVERPAATEARPVMVGGPDVADRVQRLADAESSCCVFLDGIVTERRDEVVPAVAVPPAYTDVPTGPDSRAASSLGE